MDSERKKFEEALRERFHGDTPKAVDFLQKMADLQITKSGGLLSSASLLAGLSYFLKAQIPLLLILVSLLLFLGSFYSKWPKSVESVLDPNMEFEQLVHICYTRAIFNAIGTFLIFISILILISHLV